MSTPPPVATPADYPTTGDYMAEEKARYEAKLAPQPAPIYPVSPADMKNAAVRLAQLGARVPPTLPDIVPYPGAVPGATAPALTPDELLQRYPQQINAEYLGPMTEKINEALATGDMEPVYRYAEFINPELGKGLAVRGAIVEGGEAVTTPSGVAGVAGTDGSPADGATANTAVFTVTNSIGAVMASEAVSFATTGAATLASPNGTTDASGTVTASATDATAESVTVTATAGSASGSVTLTFAVVQSQG